ncbi:cytochrome c oxidase subunit I [Edaphobacter modestus]|uniref:Cytochrome c oxidase subunit 1 n=1 Tax=Edaphobacter modestus TaxID=388466 RepID=A0A4Q7YS32_9BACT|nr:cbb3-type cytochrome c oxidase subunit I [Edaphobacter modestus]RZU39679.1 cytochrome c oxidase subunit 1 [Edaphobacter modestus]
MNPTPRTRYPGPAAHPPPFSLFSTDHRVIGRQYLVLALFAVTVGTLLSLLMRIHLVWPGWAMPLHGPILPEDYLALVTLHGTIMLFFVLTTAPQSGFGNLILPAQIGARHMAFPRMNAAGFWLTAFAFCVLLASPFVPGGTAISGWTSYPPLSAVASAGPGQGTGMDLWLVSIALFAVASTLGSINTLVTVARMRCAGMTWNRLPLTVWGWFTAALLSVLAFSVLLAALLLLLCDRHAGTSFFLPAGDLVNGVLHTRGNGSPLLWLHLFWFFGHPEVYIAILPGMGLTSMVLANFSHRRIAGYRLMIHTTLLIGLLGILLWGHHMFVAGLNPYASTAFSVTTIAIALPASAKVLSWIATTWGARPRYTAAMLFSLGFVSLFITGGLTGPVLAQPILDEYLHNTFFVVAHFHLIMAMAGVFGLFSATYYWFPLLTATPHHRGCVLSERLGRWHFWLTLVGAYATFLPMHFTGLAGEPRHYAQLTQIPNAAGHMLASTIPLNLHITYAAIFLASAQVVFFANLILSLRRRIPAPSNPWRATTLEWHPALHPSSHSDASDPIHVLRAPCDYGALPTGEVFFLPQWSYDPIPDVKRE